jgi:membrane-associated protease RseP (regulator of RpoE activity)
MLIPGILFLLTCLSTFYVGLTQWSPLQAIPHLLEAGSFMSYRRLLLRDWDQGLIYMVCVISILLAHEMGHYVATRIYRVHATLPIFLPFPFNPIGTFGAVIAMAPGEANRRQIFDIGIAGPIAGLVVAVPIMFVGIAKLDFSIYQGGGILLDYPLIFRWLIQWMGIEGYRPEQGVYISQLNPYYAAAWVGMVVTGLNMLPIGQLDGGHVTYTLFGKAAHWLARGIVVASIAFMIYFNTPVMILMLVLLIIVGTDHPPTADDSVPLGPVRTCLGLLSLAIPVLCFPPFVLQVDFGY